MAVCKVNMLLLAGCLFCCTGCQKTVPQSDYDELLQEYQALKESIGESQALSVKLSGALNQTLKELAEVSGSTLELRVDMEKGTARMTQAEKISRNIARIKKKIAQLEVSARQEKEFLKTLKNLRTVLYEKEKEIEGLKRTIDNQQELISYQEGKLDEQIETISQKEKELQYALEKLRRASYEQARTIYQAAVEIEQLAYQAPVDEVSRKKNKQKLKNYQKSILEKALFYYRKALSYGYGDAGDNIRVVQLAIAGLK